jgi:D-alanyl-D-alanine carboxypeptidase
MSTTISGKMSTFGGPKDTGVTPDENLALVYNSATFSRVPEYFLPKQPPGTTGYARRLNPETFYIACRWNYAVTPKPYLLGALVRVTNPANGRHAEAKPIDWGPHGNTGRTADLSPGLAEHLGLQTNDECVVQILHPGESGADGSDLVPAVPQGHLKVLSDAAIRAEFGDFSWKDSKTKKGAIIISPPWAQHHIVKVEVPQLRGLPNYGSGGFSGKFECHAKIAQPLVDAFTEVERQGLTDQLLFWGGCWVPRHKSWNPARGLSSHSWAIAFDLNVQWNGYDVEPAAKGKAGSVVELVPIFEAFGFAWGGYFGTKDGMHFEYCRKG